MEMLFQRLARRPLLTVLALSLVLLLSGNWILPLVDRDEPRFAEASREMIERGDYVVPRLNGDYRFDKPPFIYWCQAACFEALGETAFAARLPSVLFASFAGALLVLWGRRMGRPKAGFYAGLMFVTCLQMQVHGRWSAADALMVFFVAAAAWAGWELTRPQCANRTRMWWLFQMCMALGFLAKGPVAWLPLAGMIAGKLLRPKDFYLPWRSVAAGLAVSLILVSFWGIPALVATHGEYLYVGIGRHVLKRSYEAMGDHGASGWLGFIALLPLYFLTFFLSFFPWAFKFPAALQRWREARGEDVFGWYLLAQGLVVFAVFSLVRTKLPHYTLPAFPMLALWLGLRIAENEESAPAAERPAALAPWWARLIHKLDGWVGVPMGVALMAALSLTLTQIGFRLAAPHLLTTNLWHEISPLAKPQTRVAFVAFGEDSVEWEFRQTVTNYVEHVQIAKAGEFLKKGAPCVLVVPTKDFSDALKDAATNAVIKRVTGIDTTYLRHWDMTAIVLP